VLAFLAAPGLAGDEPNACSVPAKPVRVEEDWPGRMAYLSVGADAWQRSDAEGLVSDAAIVGQIRLDRQKVLVAVDRKAPGGTGYDTVRLDFTGRGNWAEAPTVPMQIHGAGGDRSFGQIPATLIEVPRHGEVRPTTVRGYFRAYGAQIRLNLMIACGIGGHVELGGTTHRIVLVDKTWDCRFSPPPQGDPLAGDSVMIDPGADRPLVGAVGHPMLLNGQWWRISAGEKARSIRLEPVTGPMGRLVVPGDRWTLRLTDTRGSVLSLAGDRSPVPLPAGTYTILEYEVRRRTGEEKWTTVSANTYGRTGANLSIQVDADEEVRPKIASPLRAAVSSRKLRSRRQADPQQGDQPLSLYVSVNLRDAYGTRIVSITTPRGRPKPPRIIFRDGEQVVHEAQMEYG
jgi:hypothetical protein